MKLEFLTTDGAEWGQFIDRVPHDFYHLPAYARLMSPIDGGRAEAVLVTAGDQFFFLPYLLRPLTSLAWLGDAEGLFDIVSPYGYPGPLVQGDDAFLRAAIALWQSAMQERGCVSGFIRMHPLLNSVSDIPSKCGQVINRGRTVSIDLRLPQQELWSQTRSGHRSDIYKSRRMGMVAAIEDFDANLASFLHLYTETMERTGASPYYFFPPDYFRGLKDALGENLSLCLVRSGTGDILGGTLLTECCGIVQYHLSGTFNSAIPQRPSKLMLDYARTWAKARGNHTFHLGGGFGAREDSVFDFKAGFSSSRQDFYTWQFVFLADHYARLEQRRRSLGKEILDDEFFPLYRA